MNSLLYFVWGRLNLSEKKKMLSLEEQKSVNGFENKSESTLAALSLEESEIIRKAVLEMDGLTPYSQAVSKIISLGVEETKTQSEDFAFAIVSALREKIEAEKLVYFSSSKSSSKKTASRKKRPKKTKETEKTKKTKKTKETEKKKKRGSKTDQMIRFAKNLGLTRKLNSKLKGLSEEKEKESAVLRFFEENEIPTKSLSLKSAKKLKSILEIKSDIKEHKKT